MQVASHRCISCLETLPSASSLLSHLSAANHFTLPSNTNHDVSTSVPDVNSDVYLKPVIEDDPLLLTWAMEGDWEEGEDEEEEERAGS